MIWDTEAIAEMLVTSDAEIKQLQQEMQGKPKGLMYFYQQKIQKALKHGLEVKADEDYRRYYRWITTDVADVHVNKTKRPADGKQMLLNLSLLVGKENVSAVGEHLERIKDEQGVEIRFTGPWPPYSFVAKSTTPEDGAARQ